MKMMIRITFTAICLTAFLVGPSVVDVSACSYCKKTCKERS